MDLPDDIFWGGQHSPKSSSPVVAESSQETSSPLSHLAAETSVFHDLSLFAMDDIEFLPFDAMENELQTFGELGSGSNVSLEKSGEKLEKSLEDDIDWHELLVSDFVTDKIEDTINDLRENRCAEDFDQLTVSDRLTATSEVGELMGNEQSESLYSTQMYQCLICSENFKIQDELNIHYPTCYTNLLAEVNENNVMALNEEITINIEDFLTDDMPPENTQPITLPSTIEDPKSSTSDTLTADVVADCTIDSPSGLLPELFEYIKTTLKESEVSKKAKRRRSFKIVYACSICSETFRYKLPLKYHLRKHTMNDRQISQEMTSRTKTLKLNAVEQQLAPSSVQGSKRSKHSSGIPSETLKLQEVDQQLALDHAVSLPIHGSKRSSGKVRSFPCLSCKREFSRKSRLKEHQRIHSGKKPYTCAICLFSCSQLTNLKRHIKSHEQFSKHFTCKDCNRKYATKSDVEYHHVTIHAMKQAKITPPALMANYLSTSQTSEVNGASTEEVAGSKDGSQVTKTPSINQLETAKKPKRQSGDNAVLACGLCSKKFRHRSHLLVHIQTHSSERSFVCTFCQAAFKQPNTLRNHMKTHGMEMPYPCTDCKMGFYSQTSLSSHVRRCHNAIHLCTYCGKMFGGRSRLRVHERSHTKPYNCEICTFSCSQMTNLKRHVDAHKQCLKPFNCTDCNRKFATKDDLKAHAKKPKRKAKTATPTSNENCLSTSKTASTADILNGASTEEVAEGKNGSQECTAPSMNVKNQASEEIIEITVESKSIL